MTKDFLGADWNNDERQCAKCRKAVREEEKARPEEAKTLRCGGWENEKAKKEFAGCKQSKTAMSERRCHRCIEREASERTARNKAARAGVKWCRACETSKEEVQLFPWMWMGRRGCAEKVHGLRGIAEGRGEMVQRVRDV